MVKEAARASVRRFELYVTVFTALSGAYLGHAKYMSDHDEAMKKEWQSQVSMIAENAALKAQLQTPKQDNTDIKQAISDLGKKIDPVVNWAINGEGGMKDIVNQAVKSALQKKQVR